MFLDKVRERVALAETTGYLLSPVLLLQTATGDELQSELRAAVDAAGATMLVIADSLDGATFADITSRADPIVTSMTFH